MEASDADSCSCRNLPCSACSRSESAESASEDPARSMAPATVGAGSARSSSAVAMRALLRMNALGWSTTGASYTYKLYKVDGMRLYGTRGVALHDIT